MLTVSAQQETRSEDGPMGQSKPQGQSTTNVSIAGEAAPGEQGAERRPSLRPIWDKTQAR
jgi:hypothetical protein